MTVCQSALLFFSHVSTRKPSSTPPSVVGTITGVTTGAR
jgi:hypothetical protein